MTDGWISPDGDIYYIDSDTHMKWLEERGISAVQAYSEGWVRFWKYMNKLNLQGKKSDIEKRKGLLMEELNYPQDITVDLMETPEGRSLRLDNSFTATGDEFLDKSIDEILFRSRLIGERRLGKLLDYRQRRPDVQVKEYKRNSDG